MNFAFYVSGKATRLKKIIQGNNIELLRDIKLVFSDDSSNLYLKDELNKLGIDYVLYDFKKICRHTEDRNTILSNKILEVFKEYSIEYCFCFGNRILKGELLSTYKNKIINFHPSILPAYPGQNAIDQAIQNKERYLGNTAHFIDSGVDTGLVILQTITLTDNFLIKGYDAILDLQIEMLYKIHSLLKENRIDIRNDKIIIKNVDYTAYTIFPQV